MTPPFTAITEGKARLFTMGLQPLTLSDWLWADERLAADLAEKDRLHAAHPEAVFAATDQSQDAQAETLRLIVEDRLTRRPDLYALCGPHIRVAERLVAIEDETAPPLWRVARLVQEDLVVMQASDDGWKLSAASLSFPSSWVLGEKFGKRLDDIHGHVPNFGPGTRNASIMARMFDNLRPEAPVIRWNYSLNGDDALYHPQGEPSPRFEAGVFVRMERQTLRKLPESGAILFTIRILHQPLGALAGTDGGAELARALLAQLESLSDAERAYKGLTEDFVALTAYLKRLAQA